MASMGSSSGDIFDHRKLRRLVQIMQEHDLTEIDLRQADTRLRIRRGPEQVAQIVEATGFAAAAAQRVAAAPAPAAEAPAAPAAPPVDDKNIVVIRSPMIGTFYATPKPDQPPFVKVGDRVSPTTTVCIVEAMKVFNEIPAEVSGTIVAVLVDNGEPVEYNQPLFRVDTSK
jgi:acetyl-CoA carboxylase biotin carboxyl carrier protein